MSETAWPVDELRDLQDWRVEGLLRLRFPPELAETLKDVPDVVHAAERLVAAGCDVVTAWEILSEQ